MKSKLLPFEEEWNRTEGKRLGYKIIAKDKKKSKKNHSPCVSRNVINLAILLMSFVAVSVFFSSAVSAQVESFGQFIQYKPVNLVQTWNGTLCNITSITSPNSTFYNGGLMTKSGNRFTYIFTTTSQLGKYNVCGDCDTSAWCANFEITSTGKSGNQIPIYIGIAAVIFLIISIYTENFITRFLSAVLFIIVGVFLMIYGFGDINDLYTRAIAIVSIGFGFILLIGSAFENIWGNDNDNETINDEEE